MSKKELIKELFILMSRKNYQGAVLGIRYETSKDSTVRSKDIRAFLGDLLLGDEDDDEITDLYYMLEQAIRNNIDMAKSD